MTTPIPTPERLATALESLSPPVPPKLIERARRGYYSDFGSPSDTPKQDLFYILKDFGHDAMADRVTSGEFDDTVAESRKYLRSLDFFRDVLRPAFPAISLDRWKEIFNV